VQRLLLEKMLLLLVLCLSIDVKAAVKDVVVVVGVSFVVGCS